MQQQISWLPENYDESLSLNFRRPIHTFLIKIASLCNLNCSYCYVYNSPDESWKWKSKYLEISTAKQIALRIQEHVVEHGLNDITIVFHGGEPLLVGLTRLQSYVKSLLAEIKCPVHWGLQTNGILFDDSIIQFFFQENIRFGISIDGTKEHNDRHRLYHNGQSSYNDVIQSIKLIQSYPEWKKIFGGFLIVVDLNNKPYEILQTIAELKVHSINLLLPDKHYDSIPKRPSEDISYGIWLFEFFDLWYKNYQQIEIPYFEEIISLLMGGLSVSEEIGAQSVDIIVVDTNGDIEPVDTLKIVGREATSLEMNVTTHSFNDALKHPAIYSRMSGFNTLCDKCIQCEYLNCCGGGYIPHRYSKENGFINPSVYCNDLKYLFSNIRQLLFT